MKILYIPGDYAFCYYYRGYLPGVYSNQMVVSEVMEKGKDVDQKRIVEQAKQADVVVFQRPSNKKMLVLAGILKKMGKKIIFENDDTYKGIPLHRLGNDRQREIAQELNQNLDTFLALSDGAIASTEVLAKEYATTNENVVVLKNCIDPMDEFPCKPNLTGKFRVGIIGSVTTNDDYNHIKDQLRELDERGDITLVVLGVKYKDGTTIPTFQEDYDFWASLKNIEWHPYCFVSEYMHTIANLSLDLAIIPRKEHYFNQCKSNIKFLEMSLLRIPVLAQGFSDGTSPYEDINDRVYLTLVHDNNTWYDTIVHMMDEHPYYKSIANKAHDYVIENYNIEKYADEWTKAILKLIKN